MMATDLSMRMGCGGYDPNRDYGFNWEPAYVQQGAGKYPFTYPENQAVRDFGIKHRNITGVTVIS